MFALVLVVGNIVDRIGSTPVLVGGLALEAAACAGLVWAESVLATAALLFGLGLGWNLSFVAATTAMVNRASPSERGRLIGFSDLSSGLLGAALALIGGYALQALGVVALGAGAAAIALIPPLHRSPCAARAEPTQNTPAPPPRPALAAGSRDSCYHRAGRRTPVRRFF